MQFDLDVRVLRAELSEQPRHAEGAVPLVDPQPHRAAQPTVHLVDHVPRCGGCGQRAPCLGQQQPAGRGQLDAMGGAVEQPCAEFALEGAHGGRGGGLHHVQALRGGGEAPLLRDGGERREVP
nr:hypothetical protein [Pseudonocardia xinjiangensis]